MKRKSTSQSAPARRSLGEGGFFNLRVLIAAVFCLVGVFVALFGSGLFAQTKGAKTSRSSGAQDAAGTQTPDVIQMVGPVRQDVRLRDLPYIAPKEEFDERVLTRYPHGTGQSGAAAGYGVSGLQQVQALLKNLWRPTPTMPGPLLTFEGGGAAQFCACAPPDSDGDVGPNHYVEAINNAFAIFDKTGNMLAGPTSYDSLFAPLTGTPCENQNSGDPFVMYDQIADRWVISDFAFPSFPGNSFWECIGVSQTGNPDPAAGYFLYALQVDPANPTFLGDYPKFALWPDAYYLSMNLFSPTFQGVRVYALDRASMIGGGPTHAVGFTVGLAGVGDSYS